MADAREVLEIMKGVAKKRLEMLKGGITFHDNQKRAYYQQEYEDKLHAIERLIRRLSIRLVNGKNDLPHN